MLPIASGRRVAEQGKALASGVENGAEEVTLQLVLVAAGPGLGPYYRHDYSLEDGIASVAGHDRRGYGFSASDRGSEEVENAWRSYWPRVRKKGDSLFVRAEDLAPGNDQWNRLQSP